ncbi:MAG: sugar ABC transporter substrate-binding protein [Actinomycetota bacterium]
MRRFGRLTLAAALVLLVAACQAGGGATTAAPAAPTTAAGGPATTAAGGPATTVTLVQGTDLTFHMVTHSDDGVFWSVVKKGSEDAAAAVGVTMVWSPSNNNPEKQVQDIDAAIAAGSNGLGVSLASPDAVGPAAQRAVEAGIPVITINSGVDLYKELGALTHVGQTEIVAGNGAGERFNALGATKVLCARQEQSNVGLEQRCEGLTETFGGDVVSEFVGGDVDPTAQEAAIGAILAADPDIDAVLGTGPNVAVRAIAAGTAAGRDLFIGGFDISTDIIGAIEAGDIDFTVDQQQYVQGYLPIIMLWLFNTNLNTVGGGLPVLTGPGFVDTNNVADVQALVEAGTR